MGEVVVVSGGSRGIGRAIVADLCRKGYRVATFGRSPTQEVLASWPHDLPPKALLYRQVDMSQVGALRSYVADVQAHFGSLDALVNNAALAFDGVLAMLPEEQLEQMLQVNVAATLVLTKECIRPMLVQGSGSIINISSIAALRGFAGLAAYAATKAALIGMTTSLARELGPRNIRVNALAPGFVETDMSGSLDERQRRQIIRRTPLGRLATTDDIVPVVEFLLSRDSRFITGQTLVVDGGASV